MRTQELESIALTLHSDCEHARESDIDDDQQLAHFRGAVIISQTMEACTKALIAALEWHAL